MKSTKPFQRIAGVGLVLLCVVGAVGCGASSGSSRTPTPSLTPTPVSTPTPGDTVVGDHWQIKVTDVRTSQKFGTWVEQDKAFQFVILTVEVTYVGPEDAGSYSPETVELMYTGTPNTGLVRGSLFYRGEASSDSTYFKVDSLLLSIAKGETHTETYAMEFPKRFQDFLLYFPETEAIAISRLPAI